MDKKLICLDTSILLEYFRKKNKQKTFFFELARQYEFAVSVITKLEIFTGSTEEQRAFWIQIFHRFRMLPLGEMEVDEATTIIKTLRAQNQMIELPDIFIGATAKTHNLELATLNAKHFARINNLQLLLKT